ncbi:hypothetical protein BP5796_08617 [Coleophoma crateriformis]|uniref:Mannosyl phosphorylinositol ceramide synthase SUR1 n=1 Tax=Coleophoma crateriformis TaxID=565419 RepID=A0A3D8R8E6_9HELO|nr:hypothetical protein BP5796_08617 [Coleophoma crateriformis]
MRRGTAIFLLINLIIIGFLINACSTLISLLFEDASADAILRSDIPDPGSDLTSNKPQLIPKIIHQTYINSSIPAQWKAGQQACIDLHPDYEYKLWTDEMSRKFIATEYPSFLKTFNEYNYPIQRADSIRYFVLAHYGGIYIDLDDGCARKLDPLLSYPAWLRRTIPTGISNDAMGSVPQHPFFLKVIKSLDSYNRNWAMPYITVMYSTGPLFLSVIWKQYIGKSHPEAERVRVLMPDEYAKQPWSFFNIAKGSSWHGKDAQTIFWMGQHWLLLTVLGFVAAGILGSCLWWVWTTWLSQGSQTRGRKKFSFWRSSSRDRYELLNRIA